MKLTLAILLAACGGSDDKATPDATTPARDAAPDADTSPLAVTIEFSPVVGSQPFACGQTYQHIGAEDSTITPRDFRFYASNIQLVDGSGAKVALTLTQNEWQNGVVGLVDFENFTGGCQDGTPETNLTITGTVPRAAYKGIAFDIGIPEAMNHQDLTSMPSPMNLTSLWWDWNFGHIFFAAVSHVDLAGGTNDHYFHVGATGCTGDATKGDAVTCTNHNMPHIELTSFDPTTDTITVDYGAVLAGSALTSSAGCHSFSADTCTAPYAALGLDFATGSAGPNVQHVFEVR